MTGPAGAAVSAVAHLVFKLRLGEALQSSGREPITVNEARIEVNAGAAGAWVAHTAGGSSCRRAAGSCGR